MPNAALLLLDEAGDSMDEESGELFAAAWDMIIPLAAVVAEDQDEPDSADAAEARAMFTVEVPIGEQDGFRYTFFYNEEYDDAMLDDSEKALFADLTGELPLIPQHIRLLRRYTAATDAIAFSSVTLDDEPLTSSFFRGYEMTVVFVWAMWQDDLRLNALMELQDGLPEGVGLLGVVSDVTEQGVMWDRAKAAVDSAGLTFPTITANNDLTALFRNEIITYPAFLFVDRRSRLAGGSIPADLGDITANLEMIAGRLAEIGG
jgi:hypothetical protein